MLHTGQSMSWAPNPTPASTAPNASNPHSAPVGEGDATDVSPSNNSRRFSLPAEDELRFEIPSDVTTATLTLKDGAAEIFGIELALNKPYPLPAGLNAAAFTWHGATLELVAVDSVMAYTATDTPMPSYIRAHHSLQTRRVLARNNGLAGPRAIVVGPRDVGKTTLVNLLAAYCIKANGRAIVVDIDPSASGAAGLVPGSLALSVVQHLDLEAGGLVHDKQQAVFLGHTTPRDNVAVTEAGLDVLGKVVDGVLSSRALTPEVGVLVDTSADVDSREGVDGLVYATRALRADVVFVIDAERLHAALTGRLEGTATETVLLDKSGGVVSRDEASRMSVRDGRIKGYFYGAEGELSPFSTTVEFDKVTVLKVGGVAGVVPDSALPVGAESSLDPLKPTRVGRVEEVLHMVLGVSFAKSEEEVLKVGVYGFVHVVGVSVEKNTMNVLAPSPGRIPGAYLLAGDVKWIE